MDTIKKSDNKLEVPSNNPSTSLSTIVHDVITQLYFLTGASLLLIIVYLRKKILSIVLLEGEKDYIREKELYLRLITLLSFTKSDRILIYEFNEKSVLIKSPKLQVRSPGISEYKKSYDSEEEEDTNELLYSLSTAENNTIKSIVADIKNDYIRGDLINNGVNYLITKLLTFDGNKIGILIIHYCKNGKEYFSTTELPNSEINLILLLNTLTKKQNSFLRTLFGLFK